MTEDVIGELSAELGIDPERLAVLRGHGAADQRVIADAVARTRRDQAAELDAALRRAVRIVPRPLRGRATRLLFPGGEHGLSPGGEQGLSPGGEHGSSPGGEHGSSADGQHE